MIDKEIEKEEGDVDGLMLILMREVGGVPASAGGYSESCPVFRCRQTGWELWSLAWSMLQNRERQVCTCFYTHNLSS